MIKKKFFIAPLIVLILSVNSVAYAEPSANNAGSTQENEIEDLEDSLARIDNQIEDYMYQIQDLDGQIKLSEDRIKEKEKELQEIREEYEKTKELFNKRSRALYVNGFDSYLYVLLDAESFSDFISRVSTIKTVVEYDRKIIDNFKEKEMEIAAARNTLIEENNRLLSMKVDIENKLSNIKKLKEQQSSLLSELKTYQAKEPVLKPGQILPSRGGSLSNTFGSNIVAYAKNFLGVPYVHGGSTPEGFDCSGFTKYVFANFGITLNRTASGQSKQGASVSYSELLPGDLVFYGNPAYHVGIYVGNGQFIHAPRTGDVVKIAPVSPKFFSTGRRIY